MHNTAGTSHSLGPVDFLIVTALLEERDAVLHLVEDLGPIQVSESSIYYICTLPGNRGDCKVAVTQLSHVGNVEASIHATQAISELNPSCILMVGIAAGVRGRVNLGDIVISTQIIYYEQAKQTPQGPKYRPLSIPADRFLLHSAQNYSDASWYSLMAVERPRPKRKGAVIPPEVHFGPFAVGDKVIADQGYVSALMDLHPQLIGIEMESYGVAMAAASAPMRPRFLAIRSISDFADEEKDDSWREYASAAAAAFAVGFLRYGPISLNSPPTETNAGLSEQAGSLIAIRHQSMQYIPPQTIIDSLPSKFTGFNVTELPIDQTNLYSNGRLTDPPQAVERQANLDCHIDSLLNSYPGASVAYFGIAHIPLLFHLGYCLTNKRRLHFFEFNRYTGRWEYLQGETNGPELKLDGLSPHLNDEHGDIVIRVSISNTIRPEEVAEIVPSPIASFHLRIEPPKRDVLVGECQLHDYGAKFRWMLDSIHELLPNRERTYIFYAGPVSLAVYFGQLISQTIDRRIVVYNYTAKDSPKYSWGLEITAETDSPDFWVQNRNKIRRYHKNV
jgi:nucleoside phosphorylase